MRCIILKKRVDKSIITPILISLITLGPILWHVIFIFTKNYDKLLLTFIFSVVLTVITTVSWIIYFSFKLDVENSDDEYNNSAD